MKSNKARLAFEVLEKEMEVMGREESLNILGGTDYKFVTNPYTGEIERYHSNSNGMSWYRDWDYQGGQDPNWSGPPVVNTGGNTGGGNTGGGGSTGSTGNGFDGPMDCVFRAIAFNSGYTVEEVQANFVEYYNSVILKDFPTLHVDFNTVGNIGVPGLSNLEAFLNSYGIYSGYNSNGNYGVSTPTSNGLIAIQGHVFNITGMNNPNEYNYWDAQSGTAGTISVNDPRIISVYSFGGGWGGSTGTYDGSTGGSTGQDSTGYWDEDGNWHDPE